MTVPWYCHQCAEEKGVEHAEIREPAKRWVISEDALRADGRVRGYRLRFLNLCTDHMTARHEERRPKELPGQEALWEY